MSRRRSNDPAIPVSIAIPRSLHTRLAELMSYKQSRSRWVCDAIQAKIDAVDAQAVVVRNLSSEMLVNILLNRRIISVGLAETLIDVISNLPTEETATEQ